MVGGFCPAEYRSPLCETASEMKTLTQSTCLKIARMKSRAPPARDLIVLELGMVVSNSSSAISTELVKIVKRSNLQ